MVYGIIAGLGSVGALLLFLGLRGRRVDDHPQCRRCGFDLFGLAAHRARCPECGAQLMGKRAVRIGRRKRRPAVLALGLVLLITGGAWTALLATGVLAKVNWTEYKPAWWLVIEAKSSDMEKSDAALRELVVRLAQKELSQRRIDGLVATATVLFESPPAELSRHWDRFVTGAWAGGYLDEATARQYAMSVFQPEVYLEAATLDGRPAGVVGARVVPPRNYSGGFYICELKELSIDGAAIELPPKRSIVEGLERQRPHLLSPAIDLSHGERRIEATVEWTLAAHTREEVSPPPDKAPARLKYTQNCTFIERPAHPTVSLLEIVSDDASRAAIVEAISIVLYAGQGEEHSTPTLYMDFSIENAPAAVDAELQLRSLTGEVLYNKHIQAHLSDVSKMTYSAGMILHLGGPGLMLPNVDIVLTTNCLDYPETYGPTVAPIRMWCGEIRLCDFPVQWVDRDTPGIPDSIRVNLGLEPRRRR